MSAPRTSPLSGLGVTVPVLAAPMSGGPTTPALVVAAAREGSLGFLAAGYKTAELLQAQIAEVHANLGGSAAFGVNLFVPNPGTVDADAYRRYAQALRPLAEHFGVDLPSAPVADDDEWDAKVDLLRTDPVPLVSFTFGIPAPAVVDTLRRDGTIVAQTVTDPAEARAASDAGVDLLIVQGCEAGGHSATLTPDRFPEDIRVPALISAVAEAVSLPVIAAGGLAIPSQVAATLESGAVAAMVGTALLRTPESGASRTHQAAIGDPSRGQTVLTRVFTGRAARGLPNKFIDDFTDIAPAGYPAIHHLTTGIRKAAAAAGDPEALHLWAGTGYQHATTEPTATVLRHLAGAL